jgi:hypothetical protein
MFIERIEKYKQTAKRKYLRFFTFMIVIFVIQDLKYRVVQVQENLIFVVNNVC